MPNTENLPAADLIKPYLTDSGIEVSNPASGDHVATIADMDEKEISGAIEKAERAFPAWRDRTAKDRSKVLRAWFDAIMERKEDLALLMTTEQGKVLSESRGEVDYGASFVEWFAEEAKRIYGDTIPGPATDKRVVVIKQPVGVCAAITPWNFPIAMITRKIAPGLAAGCTIVVKPSSDTPLCALALHKLAIDAGMPEGVFQVVTSSDSKMAGKVLTGSKIIRKLSFTGSTPVGKALMEQSASTLKRLSMELGGNAPFIVFDDADLEKAVDGAIACKFRNAGQTCVCANRLLVQDGIYDDFVAAFRKKVDALKVAAGIEDGAEIGPLIREDAVEKVEELIKDAVSKGGKQIGGGRIDGSEGNFFRPTIITDATPEMDLAKDEIFGPVAPVFRFTDEEEAIALANDTNVGLAGYFYTSDIARAWRMGEALEYGMIGINSGSVSTELAPFGGVKESGFGREGSKYGIEEYLSIKALHFGEIE